MKRVIVELKTTVPVEDSIGTKGEIIKGNEDPISMFSVPAGAVAVVSKDKIVLDYLTDGDTPEDAIYVGELNEVDGTVTDIVGTKEEQKHTFFGWDREVLEVGKFEDITKVDLVEDTLVKDKLIKDISKMSVGD